MGDDYEVIVRNIGLVCKHCGHTRFKQHEGQLNTALASLLGFDWLNQSADVFACAACGFLHWFLGVHLQEIEEPSESATSAEGDQNIPKVMSERSPDVSYSTTCLDCGETISAGEHQCASCGWSYLRG